MQCLKNIVQTILNHTTNLVEYELKNIILVRIKLSTLDSKSCRDGIELITSLTHNILLSKPDLNHLQHFALYYIFILIHFFNKTN